jgi:prepilin peptidase CpaA
MTIPNIYPLGIFASFIIAYGAVFLLMPGDVPFFALKSNLLSFAIVFALTFVLFSLKMIGAGDSKLAAAVALWTGVKGLLPFLFFMGIMGAVLGLFALFLQKKKPVQSPKDGSWIARVQSGESAVPYGIAIAVGAVAAFVHIGYFDPQVLRLLADHSGGAAGAS